jgi:lipid-binding SYLF domain-containing protein
MKLKVGAIAIAVSSMMFAAESKEQAMKRIDEAAKVFQEINTAEDKGIPRELLERAQCIGIIPGMKRAGFVIGGNYGKGVVVCRGTTRGWTAPAMVRVEGGSIGLQIGAGETDVVFIVMSKRGMDKLSEDKFTVGGDASAMAGPVGRSGSANTDAMMHAEILSYSRARGVFAGLTLNGSTLRPEKQDNTALYGSDVTQSQILNGNVRHPAGSEALYAALNRYAPVKTKKAA